MELSENVVQEETDCISAKAVKVFWKSIYLLIEVQAFFPKREDSGSVAFYAVDQDGRAQARFDCQAVSDTHFRLRLNITNNGYCRCLPAGEYSVAVCCGNTPAAVVGVDNGLLPEIDSLGRVFLYQERSKAYTVSFFVSEEDENCRPLRFYVMASKRTDMNTFSSPRSLSKRILGLRRKLVGLYKPAFRQLYKILSRLYRKQSHTVLFMSEQGTAIGANELAVRERMKQRGLDSSFTLLTSARPAAFQRQSVGSWISLISKIARSGYIFLGDHAPVFDWLQLSSKNQLIQLWHAGAGFKAAGYSRWGHLGCPAPQGCHRQYTFGVAGSRKIAPFFSEAWGILDSQVLPTGMPRMDAYLEEEHRRVTTEKLYEQFPICRKKQVILFAPTYRGKGRGDAGYPYELIDFEKLYQLCGEDTVVLFKMHPWVRQPVPIPQNCRDRFLDVGNYPDINDLFYISDLLITDYSSNIYEFSLMRKPMLFFAFDEVSYSFSRGFHRDYETSIPGKFCRNFEELLEAIRQKDFRFEKVETYIEHHFDYIDSHASDRVIDWILLGQMPDDLQKALLQQKLAAQEMKQLIFPPLGN